MTTRPELPEDALEPVGLIRQSGVVLRTGQLMLSAGTGSYRVKLAMQQVAHAIGLDRHTAHVTLTEITATSHRGPIFRTEVAEVRAVGVNADRIARLEALAAELPPDSTVEDVNAALDEIEARTPLYPAFANALFAGVACAAFAFLNNGGLVECLSVLIAATLGQWVRRALLHRGFNRFGVTMIAAAVACVGYLAVIAVVDAVTRSTAVHQAGYVSAVLFLVPGFALVTGALDLAKLDFSAGVSRTVYALMILTGSALSVWAVAVAAGLSIGSVPAMNLAPVLELTLRALASGCGVLGFALMFNTPRRMALTAAGIGMVGNVARLAMVDRGVVVQAATAISCVVIGMLAAWAASWMKFPNITLSVPAVLIMVPGVAAYRTVVSFNDGKMIDALANGVQGTFVVVSIVVGLVIAKILTDREWAFEK